MLLGGLAAEGQDGVHDGGVIAVLEQVSWRRDLDELGQCAYVPIGRNIAHAVQGVVSGAPVCPSSTSVPYFGQSCGIRSTYITPVYGSMLFSAGVQAWTRILYNVNFWGAGLGRWVTVSSRSSASVAFSWCTLCTRVYSSLSPSGVQSKWTSPVDAEVGLHVAVRA